MSIWTAMSYLHAKRRGASGNDAAHAAFIGQLVGSANPAVSLVIADRIAQRDIRRKRQRETEKDETEKDETEKNETEQGVVSDPSANPS